MTDRITVALTARAAAKLEDLRRTTGLSKTDLVNRALGLYAFTEAQLSEGRQLATYDPEAQAFQVVHIV